MTVFSWFQQWWRQEGEKEKKSIPNTFSYFISRNDKVSLTSLSVCFNLLSHSQPFSSQKVKQLLPRLFKTFRSPSSTSFPHWTHSTHTSGFALICRWISFIFTCFSLSAFSEHGYIAFLPKILIGIHNVRQASHHSPCCSVSWKKKETVTYSFYLSWCSGTKTAHLFSSCNACECKAWRNIFILTWAGWEAVMTPYTKMFRKILEFKFCSSPFSRLKRQKRRIGQGYLGCV